MSKSLGNFITIGDFLRRCPANFLRFFVLKTLWHSPIDYSESTLIEVRATIAKIEDFLRRIKSAKTAKGSKDVLRLLKSFKENFYAKLDDDFNTPEAFAVLFDFMKEINVLDVEVKNIQKR